MIISDVTSCPERIKRRESRRPGHVTGFRQEADTFAVLPAAFKCEKRNRIANLSFNWTLRACESETPKLPTDECPYFVERIRRKLHTWVMNGCCGSDAKFQISSTMMIQLIQRR